MPLPISHSLAGAGIGLAVEPRARSTDRAVRLGLAVLLANAPDLDLVPGLLIGDPNRFHHGWTHSLLTALAAGAVVWLIGRWRGGTLLGLSPPMAALSVAGLLGSHVLLDLLTTDTRAPLGLPALWPLSDRHFYIGGLFLRAERLAGPGSPVEFFASLWSAHTARALVLEALLVGPWLALVWLWRRRSG